MRDVDLVSTTQQHKHQKSFKRGSHEIIKMNMGKMGKACMLTCFSSLQHVSDLSLLMLDMLAWHEVVGQWARKEVYPTEKVDITKPQAVPQGPVQPGSNRVQHLRCICGRAAKEAAPTAAPSKS